MFIAHLRSPTGGPGKLIQFVTKLSQIIYINKKNGKNDQQMAVFANYKILSDLYTYSLSSKLSRVRPSKVSITISESSVRLPAGFVVARATT